MVDDIVKSSMKSRSRTYGKARKPLPLREGSEKDEVETPDGRNKRAQETVLEIDISPLTLFPKERGDTTFDSTKHSARRWLW
jgi:hypothetical protein